MSGQNSFKMDMKVAGVSQFDSGIQRLKDGMPEVIKQVNLSAANLTIKAAKPLVPTKSGKSAASLRAYLTGQSGIAEGGSTVSHYRWLELGGRSGRKLSIMRSIVSDGRYIHPGYVKQQAAIQAVMDQTLNAKVKNVGLA